MGFDLNGIDAKNKDGDYFRNNVWWWRGLWAFCKHTTPELTDDDFVKGQFNDGHVIDGIKHEKLIEKLKFALSDVDSKKNKEFVKNWWVNNNDNYPFNWDNVKEFLKFIENNRGFEIC